MAKTNVICILPIKNEAWILKNFIECARTWADLIIIGDHNSKDDSARIAQQYDCVRIIPLNNPSFDASIRRKILLDEARKVPNKRLIFSIDADEMISANWTNHPEWDFMLNASPGTSFEFSWIEVLPGLKQGAVFSQVAAFIDDGLEYSGKAIHEPRIPLTKGNKIQIKDIKLLHYILIDPNRMLSKHRWYKCIEIVEFGKHPWATCIMYQDTKPKIYDAPIVPVMGEWIAGYKWLDDYIGIEDSIESYYWYDEEILNFFDQYGTAKFRKLNIWDIDWNKIAHLLGRTGNYNDPRSQYEKWVHRFIEKNREDLKMKQTIPLKAVRLIGKTVLRSLGW